MILLMMSIIFGMNYIALATVSGSDLVGSFDGNNGVDTSQR